MEPDFDAFARRLARGKERDVRADGRLNPLGRWDWEDLALWSASLIAVSDCGAIGYASKTTHEPS